METEIVAPGVLLPDETLLETEVTLDDRRIAAIGKAANTSARRWNASGLPPPPGWWISTATPSSGS